jgi:hypothetical protein
VRFTPDLSITRSPSVGRANSRVRNEVSRVLGETAMLTLDLSSSASYASSAAALPSYSVNSVKALPSDAAPMGRLSDGEVYVEPYKFLTSSDVSLLHDVTGQSFDPKTIARETAKGTFQGNALAAAIGWDRATGILQGNISTAYLQNIQSVASNRRSAGYYEGFKVSDDQLSDAIADLASQSGSTVNISV